MTRHCYPPPLIPPEARRPLAKAIVKGVLARRGVSVERFFSPEKEYVRNLQVYRVKLEIIERLFKELNYTPTLIGKVVRLEASTIRHHLIKMNIRKTEDAAAN